jgi:hypothetical protein
VRFLDALLLIARAFLFVREALDAQGRPTNRGPWVEAILRVAGGKPGDPWCAAFVSIVLGLVFRGKSPLPATTSCDALLEHARAKGWLVDDPEPGDVGLLMKSPRDATHTFLVVDVVRTGTRATAVATIEGNTNRGGSRDGLGAFERTGPDARVLTPGKYKFIRYPRPERLAA